MKNGRLKTEKASHSLHTQPTACVATPHTLPETFAKKPFLRQLKLQTQVFGCFCFEYPLILLKYPLNPPRTPDNQASGPPFRRQQTHLAC